MNLASCQRLLRYVAWWGGLLIATPVLAGDDGASASKDIVSSKESVHTADASMAETNTGDVSWLHTLFSSGEYTAEETYVGEASVRSGNKVVSDYDEHDTLLRFLLTPRIKFGVLRVGVMWERFSFGFPDHTPIPNTLQSGAVVIGLDTQLSNSILLRVEAQPGFYGTTDFAARNFSIPFIVGGTYLYSPTLQFVAGVSVDIERKYPVLPAAGIRWKMAQQWVLNAILPDPRLEFEATRNLMLYAGGNFKETNFRVGQVFGNQKGISRLNGTVLTYSEVRAGVGAEWKLASFANVSAEVGYQPYRSFDYYRADIRFHEEGSAPYGMLSVHGSF
jgi:hypothetical protein